MKKSKEERGRTGKPAREAQEQLTPPPLPGECGPSGGLIVLSSCQAMEQKRFVNIHNELLC